MIQKINELVEISKKFYEFQRNSIPLCAAENIMSDFCKLPLSADFQERYIMGSAYEYSLMDNFIGSKYLIPFYKMLDRQCNILFNANFTDARTLTGMNCLTTILMSLAKPGDNIMIQTSDFGGHASVKGICERLGLNVFNAPYLLENYDFNYTLLNSIVEKNNIKLILIAPSDILFPLDLLRIDNDELIILNDVSQCLGLIAAKIHRNLLPLMPKMVMFGGTHKTLPGPSHGLAMTNNEDIFKILDKSINPKYLRNTQMHQVICLLFCLIEAEYYGEKYQENIVKTSNALAKYLSDLGFTLAKKNGYFSQTHQIFIECSEEKMFTLFNNAVANGVTFNTKKKALFHGGYGIRLGTQEIARYNWDDDTLKKIAEIIYILSFEKPDLKKIAQLKKQMPPKIINWTFDKETVVKITDILGFEFSRSKFNGRIWGCAVLFASKSAAL
jgi:glycine/serine hydroxymethyltransferase